ncbi:MAG: 50S ribosomal protein L10 [Bacteroidetes bacterium]|jgi:large subunit ribosomal protein L10|nr:50S ribosomal protein L10 [Bacteroidota bacterium]MBT3583097.1 50S ribosomal protein L10 [Candidatus Woesearchaeota archaeon]MBT6687321.1 50S ribosomal protein L10 [Bacteroidota bacterium]MBT7143985.1 50S ribosomal protein L10 [Bacteroidota bacterium]MBT7491102.1 50S ribosomal protein L10 [Bacteroidota bacterium]
MKREEKNKIIDSLIEQINKTNHFYLTDISELNAEKTSSLRRACFEQDIKLTVVKNTLLKKAMEKAELEYDELYEVLKGSTSIMFTEVGNQPAKLIQEFRRSNDKPILKGAFVEEGCYIGDDQLDALINVKSRDELVADIIALLQSPAKNVISALQSGGSILHGVLETLSERE